MSNPAPRYIQTVAEAFKSGLYVSEGISFGTGKYGDLAATFAAIYLERAARNVLLDKDISSGSLREPVLKVTSLMRSMGFVSHAPVIATQDVVGKIGQMAYEFPSVFSFFEPENKPSGPVGNAALLSPEATLLDIPSIVGSLNSLTSMIKFGFSSCEGGLARSKCRESEYLPSTNGILEFNKTFVRPEGKFSFETFEGPSLRGGLDNRWVGHQFRRNDGKITVDPLDGNNHALSFPTSTSTSSINFFSEPIQNIDSNGNRVVVKFRYLGMQSDAGGCIGWASESTVSITWALCDRFNTNNNMPSNGNWISCQFAVPSHLASFRIFIGDRVEPQGDVYFDDIQIANGNTTTCTGVDVPKNDPPGQEGYSNTVVDKLATLLTAGRLGTKAKSIIVDAFDRAGSADDGLILAQQLIAASPEFHTTDIVERIDQPRDQPTFPEPTVKPYKAVVYLMFVGGCDSFNMLVPHTCNNGLYESYLGELCKRICSLKIVELLH